MRIAEFYKDKQGKPYSSPLYNPYGGFGIPPYSIHGVHLAGEFSSTKESDTYTAGDEMVILVDAFALVTITLPTNMGHVYWIKKIDNNGGTVTIVGEDTTALIDGESSLDLNLQYQYVMLICDGTEWFILGGEYVKMEDILLKIEEAQEKANNELRLIKMQLERVTDEHLSEQDIEEE